VLLNLLLNAQTPPTQWKGHAESEPVGRGAFRRREDSGPGIVLNSRATLRTICDHQRGRQRVTGLGLAVCRGLVESAHGTIRVDESYRPGARFGGRTSDRVADAAGGSWLEGSAPISGRPTFSACNPLGPRLTCELDGLTFGETSKAIRDDRAVVAESRPLPPSCLNEAKPPSSR